MNPIARNAKDFWTGAIYVAVGGTAMYLARDYGMGSAVKMGPAYFPTILSGILIVIGIVSIVRSFLKDGTPIGTFAGKGLVLIVAATLLFGLTVRGAGMVVALPLMILVSSFASEKFHWQRAVLLGVGVTAFCILIFQIGLGVPLPILGPWFGF